MGRRAAGRVARHPQEHLFEFGGVMVRGQDPLQRVAAHAQREKSFLPVGAGKAKQPFSVRELRHQIFDFAELEVGGGGGPGGDVDCLGAVEFVADGADRDCIFARLDPAGQEAVAALRIGRHGGRDGRPIFLGADQHPLHCTLFIRGYAPGQSILRICTVYSPRE